MLRDKVATIVKSELDTFTSRVVPQILRAMVEEAMSATEGALSRHKPATRTKKTPSVKVQKPVAKNAAAKAVATPTEEKKRTLSPAAKARVVENLKKARAALAKKRKLEAKAAKIVAKPAKKVVRKAKVTGAKAAAANGKSMQVAVDTPPV